MSALISWLAFLPHPGNLPLSKMLLIKFLGRCLITGLKLTFLTKANWMLNGVTDCHNTLLSLSLVPPGGLVRQVCICCDGGYQSFNSRVRGLILEAKQLLFNVFSTNSHEQNIFSVQYEGWGLGVQVFDFICNTCSEYPL